MKWRRGWAWAAVAQKEEISGDTLPNRANEILKSEELGRYPAGNVRLLKVAETTPGGD